jgi:ribosomal protein S6
MYEITFITKEEKDPVVKSTIEGMEGKILSENLLGRKKFVYPIKKEEAGFYTSYIFELEPQKVNKLNSALRLKNQILRYLIVAKKIIIAKPIKEKNKEVKTTEETKKPEQITAEKPEEKIIKKEIKKTTTKTKKQTTKKTIKPVSEVADKIEKSEENAKEKANEEPKEKNVKEESKIPAEKETVSDEKERLKALEDKLEEILKD